MAPEPLSEALQRQRALSRWDNEGGAETDGPQAAPHAVEGQLPFPKMGDAEFEALHVRVIALENLVIALLVAASDQELNVAREMVSYIFAEAGLHASFADRPCGRSHDGPHRAGRSFPQQDVVDKAFGVGDTATRGAGAWQGNSRSETT